MAKGLWIAIAVVVLLIGYGVYVAYHNASLDSAFTAVTQGATPEEVVALMGEPSAKRGCADAVTWLEHPVLGKKCAFEYRYDAKVMPNYWTIGFDDGHHAIAKYAYVSP